MGFFEEIGKEKQAKYQDRILSWNNSVMDFEEGRIRARGTVEITANDWGVTIMLTSDSFDKPVRLSDRQRITTRQEAIPPSNRANRHTSNHTFWSFNYHHIARVGQRKLGQCMVFASKITGW